MATRKNFRLAARHRARCYRFRNLRELLITAVILAPCAREFLGVGADVAEVISGAEPG